MTGSASLDFFPGRQQAPQPLRDKEGVPALLHLPVHPALASDLTTCLGIFIAAHGGTEAG